jgi:hypothetical protein
MPSTAEHRSHSGRLQRDVQHSSDRLQSGECVLSGAADAAANSAAQGTIRQRIKRVYKAKPGKVTIRDLLSAVPSRREQNTWTFAFAVTWLAWTLPPNTAESVDCLDYMTQRGRYARGPAQLRQPLLKCRRQHAA